MLLENLPYPQDRRVHPEATTLAAAGYRVSVICPAGVGQDWRETLDGVRVYRFMAPPAANSFLGYLWEYGYSMAATFAISLFVFFDEGFDVIHAHNPPDTFVFIAAFYKLFGKRFVYDHHDLSAEMYWARFGGRGSRLVYRTLVWLEKLSCRLADQVIATNESHKKIEMERDGVPEARITVVRNGVDLHRDRPVKPHPALRENRKPFIGYAGVMGFQDGVDYLLRALHHLVYDFGRTNFSCVLVGGGDAFGHLKSLAEHLNLADHVWFTGLVNHEEVAGYLCMAEICVAPEPSDLYNDRSTAVKMMEYMALAKPVVAFDLPEHRFTADGAAVYVKPNDEREFARALAELMDDPTRREAMGLLGRRRFEAKLAWQHSIPNLLEVYRRLFREPRDESEAYRERAIGSASCSAGRPPHIGPHGKAQVERF
jgi:glycosyltransferase involved in cell wall biosynthesis